MVPSGATDRLSTHWVTTENQGHFCRREKEKHPWRRRQDLALCQGAVRGFRAGGENAAENAQLVRARADADREPRASRGAGGRATLPSEPPAFPLPRARTP